MKHKSKVRVIIQIFISMIVLLQSIYVRANNNIGENILPMNIDIYSKPQHIEGEFVIKYKDSASQYEKFNILSREKLQVIDELEDPSINLVKSKSKLDLNSKIKRLQNNPNIEYIEPNYLYYPMEIKDTRFNELWGLRNTGQNIRGTKGMPNIDIDVLNAWNYTKGNEDVVIAVIDTGIDTAHPDLKDRIWRNPNEILNGLDSDGNRYIDDIHGWDFLNNDNTVFDYDDGDYHGTHIAGIIAGTLNDVGIVGVAPNVKIMPLKFLGTNEYGETVGTLSDLIKAIEYAKNKGIRIVNASWGNYEHSQILEDAIRESEMLFIVASGNESIDTDIRPSYPANFNLPNIISVGAVNNRGEYAGFSNYGKYSVHVAAPGVDILSNTPLTRYKSAAIYNDNGIYRTIFHGFGLEMLEIEDNRIELLLNILDILEVSKNNSILLVQDDESNNPKYNNYLNYYEEPLIGLGFHNLDIYKVNQHNNGPSFDTMHAYDLVIWFTGEGFGALNGSVKTLTEADQENIIEYLENGGKFYLSGKDASEKNEESVLFKEYLSVNFLKEIGVPDENEGKRKNIILGQEGTIFEGKSYITSNTIYADIVQTLGESKAFLVYGNSNTLYDSYMYSSGTSMATPYVTGIAALLESLGGHDIFSIKSLILRSTNYLFEIENKVLTSGIINATKAINKYLSGDTNYLTDFSLDMDSIVLDTKLNNEYTLIPRFNPINVSDKRIKWISSNEGVAIVDNEGKVKAIDQGEATIIAVAMDGGFIFECRVVVEEYNYPVVINEALYDDQGIRINLKMISEDIIGTIIVQTYDENNRPLGVIYSDNGILEYNYSFIFDNIQKSISHVKVFVWDSIKGMKPLAEPWSQ